jgi:hypothetical protein
MLCSKPIVAYGHLCKKHALKQRKRCRNRYRLAHGIPLDAPIRVGRPRLKLLRKGR